MTSTTTPTSWARTMRDHRLPGRPVDGPTLHLLDRLTAAPAHVYDVLTVCEAIEEALHWAAEDMKSADDGFDSLAGSSPAPPLTAARHWPRCRQRFGAGSS